MQFVQAFRQLICYLPIAAAFSMWGCRVPNVTAINNDNNQAQYNNPDRVMEAPAIPIDPNAPQEPATEVPSPLSLTSETPCVAGVASSGSASDRKLREALSREFMQRVCKKTPESAKPWRNSNSHVVSSWAAGINLTAVTQNVPRGTAVTSRHVLYTKHYGYHGKIGQTLNFLTTDNQIVSRKIIGVKYLSDSFSPDVAVIRLESDLPDSITPMRNLSSNSVTLIPDFTPVLRIDQENKALISGADRYGVKHININPTMNPPGSVFNLYYESMITGDSSSPSILLFQTKTPVVYEPIPILFGLVTYAGPGSGPQVGELAGQIHGAISSFGDRHVMTSVDLARLMSEAPNSPAPSPPAKVAPTCSVTAARVGRTARCNVSVTVFGQIKGVPSMKPAAPTKWSQSGSVWRGVAGCPIKRATTFQARVSGPNGSGSCAATNVPAVK